LSVLKTRIDYPSLPVDVGEEDQWIQLSTKVAKRNKLAL
jgi:hypothetical protein